MAIKDQCNNCKKVSTQDCGQVVDYNGQSCEYYVRRINLTKEQDSNFIPADEEVAIQSEPTSSFWASLFSFNGRSRRTRYWLTGICAQLPFLPANVAAEDMPEGVAIFTLLIFLPAMWILFANIAKRCHDLGKSGLFGLLLLIPLVNIIIGIYLAFFQGDLEDNEYGPSPY